MKRIVFLSVHFFLNAALFFAIASATGGAVKAQAARDISSSARRIEEFNKQGQNASRDQMNSEMRGRKPSGEELRRTKAVNAQIEEDLKALQIGYNDIVVKLQSKETLTDSFVIETAGRIQKHALRLKGLIKFPELKDEKTADAGVGAASASVRKQLVDLCNEILAFFDSSLFESPNVLDVQKANVARQTLDSIIQRSGKLKEVSVR